MINEHLYKDELMKATRPKSKRPNMTLSARAAQFSPFAALQGYDSAIKEVGRLTDEKKELADNAIELLDIKLQILRANIGNCVPVEITHFVDDNFKKGGKYLSVKGIVKKYDEYNNVLILENNHPVLISNIINIESEMFNKHMEI